MLQGLGRWEGRGVVDGAPISEEGECAHSAKGGSQWIFWQLGLP